MGNSTMTIHIDYDLKERAEAFFAHHGMDVSTAFINFIRKSIDNDNLVFGNFDDDDPPYTDHEIFYSEKNQSVINDGIKAIEEGRVVSMSFDDLMTLSKKLLAENS